MTPVLIRPARRSDQSYVTSTWAQALCNGHEACDGHRRGNAERRSCNASRQLVDRMTDHPAVKVLVAAEAADSDRIIGWLAYSEIPGVRMLHFVYVRTNHRGKGIAAKLRARAELDHSARGDYRPLVYTMRGPCLKSLCAKNQTAIYQPITEFLAP
jgi:GNAT superfamily N-acetyltransferase